MAFNVIEDLLMPAGTIIIVLVGALTAFAWANDSVTNKAKKISPLHEEVLTAYWDNCFRQRKTTSDSCQDAAVDLAISKGYADKLPGIFKDASIHLDESRLARLKAVTSSN